MRAFDDLGPGERKAEEYRVACREIGDWDTLPHVRQPARFGNRDVRGEGRASKHANVDFSDHVLGHPESCGDPPRGLEPDLLALTVTEGERIKTGALGLPIANEVVESRPPLRGTIARGGWLLVGTGAYSNRHYAANGKVHCRSKHGMPQESQTVRFSEATLISLSRLTESAPSLR